MNSAAIIDDLSSSNCASATAIAIARTMSPIGTLVTAFAMPLVPFAIAASLGVEL